VASQLLLPLLLLECWKAQPIRQILFYLHKRNLAYLLLLVFFMHMAYFHSYIFFQPFDYSLDSPLYLPLGYPLTMKWVLGQA